MTIRHTSMVAMESINGWLLVYLIGLVPLLGMLERDGSSASGSRCRILAMEG